MKNKSLHYVALAGVLMTPLPSFAAEQQPKLVLQITVDALRGDLLDSNTSHIYTTSND